MRGDTGVCLASFDILRALLFGRIKACHECCLSAVTLALFAVTPDILSCLCCRLSTLDTIV